MTHPDTRSPDTPVRAQQSGTPALPCVVQLDRSGDWMSAVDLRSTLLQAQQQGQTVVLDFGGLRCSETTTLQVLLSAARTMTLTASTLSNDLRTCLRAAGAATMLGDMLEVA